MAPFRKRNLNNIEKIFQEKTGTDFSPAPRVYSHKPLRTALILAGILCWCVLLAAFAYPLFTPLDGDELSLSATYEGSGIVSIFVENKSDKKLEFEPQLKLIRWVGSEEVPRLSGDVIFENTRFDAHSSGIMTVDLSQAYDIGALEQDVTGQWYYLLLTNHDFLFGHDWMCSVSFAQEETVEEPEPEETEHISAVAENAEQIDEALRFYFEDAYGDMLPAFNEANFIYLQTVQEYLMRFEGRVVTAVDPLLIIQQEPEGIVFDETYPLDEQYRLTGQNHHIFDGYGRIFGATDFEKALVLSAYLPGSETDTDSGIEMPLVYFYTYEVSAIQSPEDYAFIYGQIYTFAELESYKVYEDSQHVVYNATDLIYTDLDAYIDYFYSINQTRMYLDESLRQRIYNIYNYYMDASNTSGRFYYVLPDVYDQEP